MKMHTAIDKQKFNRELARLMQYEPDLTLVRGWVERTENGETVIHALVSCRLT